MAYRNKTYVIFDGDNDMYQYNLMKAWKQRSGVEFPFFDAHEIKKIPRAEDELYIKRVLRERLENTKQALVLIGKRTKYLHKFVGWEISVCIEKNIPILAVNLNGLRGIDPDLCPAPLKTYPAMHIPFGLRIIAYSMDEYCDKFAAFRHNGPWWWRDHVYTQLGL